MLHEKAYQYSSHANDATKFPYINSSPLQIYWYDDVIQKPRFCIEWLSFFFDEMMSFYSMVSDVISSSSGTIIGDKIWNTGNGSSAQVIAFPDYF